MYSLDAGIAGFNIRILLSIWLTESNYRHNCHLECISAERILLSKESRFTRFKHAAFHLLRHS